MAENVRTREQLEDVFREAACLILGIPEDDSKKIRFGWGSSPGTGSAPSFSRNSNTVVIYFLTTDGPNNRTKDLSYIDEGNEKLTYMDEHTDVHQVQYVCYGPHAFEWARAIRDGMSLDDVRSLFRRNSLFFVTPVPAPVPAPEVFEGEWWNRYDVRVNFNEGVRIEKKNAVGYVEQVPLTTSSADKPSFRSLRTRAKELGIRGYSVMDKDQLIAAITQAEAGKEEHNGEASDQ